MLPWLLLLCTPYFASAFDKDALFQGFVSKLSSNLSDPVPLPDLSYHWTDRTMIFWKQLSKVTCGDGHADPLTASGPLEVPAGAPAILIGNVLEGAVLVPRFGFRFESCLTDVYFQGIEPYSGSVGNGYIQFTLTLEDSEAGCVVKIDSKFGDFLDIEFDKDITAAKLVEEFYKLPQLKKQFEANIIEGMDSYLSQFKEVTLSERCPSS